MPLSLFAVGLAARQRTCQNSDKVDLGASRPITCASPALAESQRICSPFVVDRHMATASVTNVSTGMPTELLAVDSEHLFYSLRHQRGARPPPHLRTAGGTFGDRRLAHSSVRQRPVCIDRC
jgi:hypothetical protein